ncbi:MAG: DNA repair exonuclease [Spirochaetales bacterium]|nr:DNA repair exonuclease [Spirochaetales bacterium]
MNNSRPVRILFFSDTHLGFDYPLHPRIERRRRGDDFFNNYHHIIETARREQVDCVVHGGDLFFRSKVPQGIVIKAFEPLADLAAEGIPVFLVPGNHERSKIPASLFAIHDDVNIFHHPSTFMLDAGGMNISLSGFPYHRENIRMHFKDVISTITAEPAFKAAADVRILCIHHIVEGARVGVFDYVFRSGEDVIRGEDISDTFDLVLSGHIHRYQILTSDLRDRALPANVYYPGSIERTSFAERNEVKGYLILEIRRDEQSNRPLLGHQFIPLPARPMVSFDIHAAELSPENLKDRIGGLLSSQDEHSVVRICIRGELDPETKSTLTAEMLRSLAPPTMNVDLSFPGKLPHVDGQL